MLEDYRELLNNHITGDLGRIDKVIEKLKASNRIAVIGHLEPDGDAVGSQLAMMNSLKTNGWDAAAFNVGPFENRFLKSNKKYFKKELDKEYDVYLILDTPSLERAGELIKKTDISKTVVIDHHPTNHGYGKINWVNEDYLSTAEMIFVLLFRMGIGLNDRGICQNLMHGIIADNGAFQHIRKEKYFSLLVSYILIENGADPKYSYDILFGKKSLSSRKLLSFVLDRIETLKDGKILWTYITEKDRLKFKNTVEDNMALYREMLSVDGVEVVIYFKVQKNKVDVSMRSTGKHDVASIAKELGGGGHKAAAGLSIKGSLEDAKDAVLKRVMKVVK